MQVEMIPGGNPGPYTGEGNRTYLLRGRQPLLVDAGPNEPAHVAALERALAVDDSRLARVLVTHAHGDHFGGAEQIARRWPAVRFLKRPWPGRDDRVAVRCEPIADGERVPAGDVELEVVHTPGHSPDHVALWHAPSRTLFSGDLLVQTGTVVIPASRGGRLSDYLRSLERVVRLNPARALPAHGPVIERPTELARGYLVHRARRERQILEVLRDGPATAAAIAGRVYELVPEALRDAAVESVLAHLVKLEEERRVVAEDGTFRVA